MWVQPRLDNRLVTITFQPQMLTCSIIKPSATPAPLTLHAYKRYNLHNMELERLIIFNPTEIKQHIHNFLRTHNALNAFVACALKGPRLFEQFVPLNTPHAQPDDFTLPELKHLAWDYRYIYPADNGQSMFYVTGIARELLLQYQLLAIKTRLNLVTLTCQQLSLLNLYEYQRGATFRTSQLAIDMLRHHNITEYLFNQDALSRMLYVPANIGIDRSQEMSHLLAACGLFVGQTHYA